MSAHVKARKDLEEAKNQVLESPTLGNVERLVPAARVVTLLEAAHEADTMNRSQSFADCYGWGYGVDKVIERLRSMIKESKT